MTRRAGLDREAVIQAAAALADSEGLDALTLTILAQRLGIRTPSLYNHVPSLEGLRRELALLALRELSRRLSRATIGKTRDSAIMALAQAYRDFVHEHPGLYAATLRVARISAPEDQEWLAAEEDVSVIVLAVIASYGMKDDDALHIVRALRSLIHGFASLENNGGFGLSLDINESFRRSLEIFLHGLKQLQSSTFSDAVAPSFGAGVVLG